MMKKTDENGRSMIEMLGVLAIIGVLSVGGIAGFSKAMEKYRVNKTIQQVTYIAGNIRTLFGSQKSYDDLPVPFGSRYTDFHRKTKIVPEEIIEGDSIKNSFGGEVYVSGVYDRVSDYDPTNYDVDSMGRAFYIQYGAIPQESCITLMTSDWETEGLISITAAKDGMTINDVEGGIGAVLTGCQGNGHVVCPGGSVTPVPMSVEKAVKACDGNGSDNIIMWVFH